MKKIAITEGQIKKIWNDLLNEEVSRVSRNDFSRTQFKIEELENSLNDTIREFGKLQESMPDGLKYVSNKKLQSIGNNLSLVKSDIQKIKALIRNYKKKLYFRQPEIPQEQPIQEKKK